MTSTMYLLGWYIIDGEEQQKHSPLSGRAH